jgi:hypothetical protein
MATLTLRLPPAGAPVDNAPARPRAGFWRRWYDAIVEAQMRRAQAEVARHEHFIPRDPVKEAGYRGGLKDVGALPFVR